MQNNISNTLDKISSTLTKHSLLYTLLTKKKTIHTFTIQSKDFAEAIIVVVDNKDDIGIYFDILYNGIQSKYPIYSTCLVTPKPLTEAEIEDNLLSSINKFVSYLLKLLDTVESIKKHTDKIKNLCFDSGLNLEDFIEIKM